MKIKYILFLFIFIIWSCSKEDIANKKPSVYIVNPIHGSEFQKGESIMINAEAQDIDGTINSVYFYIDDIEVYSTKNAPYDYNLSTNLISNGEHWITVKAVDNSNEESHAVCKVTIKQGNVMSIYIPTNELNNNSYVNDIGWIFITDKNGNVLGIDNMENGKIVNFSSTYIKSDLQLHVLTVSTYNDGSTNAEMSTYTDLDLDSYQLNISNNSTNVGQATVCISDLYNYKNFLASNSGFYQTYFDLNTNRFILNMKNQSDKLFISYTSSQDERPYYLITNNLLANSLYTYKVSDFKQMSNSTTFNFQDNTYSSISVNGYNDLQNIYNGLYRIVEHIDKLNNNYAKIYFPSNLFSNFQLFYYVENKTGAYDYQKKSFNINLPIIPDYNVNSVILNSNPNNFIVKNEGNFDRALVRFLYSNTNQNFTWDVFCNDSNYINFKLPEIPKVIQQNYSFISKSNIKLSFVALRDYDSFTSYKEYIKHFLQSNKLFWNIGSESKQKYFLFNQKKSNKTKTINESIRSKDDNNVFYEH